MRQSYLKNAALMTGTDILLRLAGMGLRIYLANALGGEGMGLYQLVLAVYSLFVTLATAGVSVAATRLMTEELSRAPAEARGMLVRLLSAGIGLGALSMAAQFGLAGLAAKWWLGDVRAAASLRVSAFGLPWMAVSAVLRGFFIARRRVEPNLISQLGEQTVRIGLICFALEWAREFDTGEECTVVMLATAVSEAVSTGMMLLFYRREAAVCFGKRPAACPKDPARRLWEILWPVEGGRCLSSALRTAENMLVPACLTIWLAASGQGAREEAVTQYGNLKGMALPLLTFPFGLLSSLSVLLMPEVTQAYMQGETCRLQALVDRMLRLTGYFSALGGALFWVWGTPLAWMLYHSTEAGAYLEILGPAMPLFCMESMVDGAMKGIGEQRAGFRYSVWDSIFRIGGVMLLLPHFGMKGFLFVILMSSFYTCIANTSRLLRCCGMPPHPVRWLGAPGLAAILSAVIGSGLRDALSVLSCEILWKQLAVLVVGGTGMSLIYFALAWRMGLGEELRAIFEGKASEKQGRRAKNAGNAESSGHRRKK